MAPISAADVLALARAAGLHLTAERAELLAPQVNFLLAEAERMDLLFEEEEAGSCPKPSTP